MKALAAGPVAAAVIDLDLPGRSGLDLVEEMRGRAALRDLPVVMLASAASEDVLDRARGLGVQDVVAKFDRPGLMAALAESGQALDLAA